MKYLFFRMFNLAGPITFSTHRPSTPPPSTSPPSTSTPSTLHLPPSIPPPPTQLPPFMSLSKWRPGRRDGHVNLQSKWRPGAFYKRKHNDFSGLVAGLRRGCILTRHRDGERWRGGELEVKGVRGWKVERVELRVERVEWWRVEGGGWRAEGWRVEGWRGMRELLGLCVARLLSWKNPLFS